MLTLELRFYCLQAGGGVHVQDDQWITYQQQQQQQEQQFNGGSVQSSHHYCHLNLISYTCSFLQEAVNYNPFYYLSLLIACVGSVD